MTLMDLNLIEKKRYIKMSKLSELINLKDDIYLDDYCFSGGLDKFQAEESDAYLLTVGIRSGGVCIPMHSKPKHISEIIKIKCDKYDFSNVNVFYRPDYIHPYNLNTFYFYKSSSKSGSHFRKVTVLDDGSLVYNNDDVSKLEEPKKELSLIQVLLLVGVIHILLLVALAYLKTH